MLNGKFDDTSRRRAAASVVPALADGHVHLYPEVEVEAALEAARRNAERLAAGVGAVVLAIADPHGVDGFDRVARLGTVGAWRLAGADSRHARIEHAAGAEVVMLRGWQLVTQEGLEVLAAGCDSAPADGRSLGRTLDEVRAKSGWATIAWGVGKWLGRRGKLVTAAVRAEGGRSDVALGDNGGRPYLWHRVPQFALAAELGMCVLPGTDPLRVRGDERRIASYGFELELPCADGVSIDRALRSVLENRAPVRICGGRMGTAKFARNQLLLRLKSRRPASRRVRE